MFLDKFKDRYSFNCLSTCGWIVFILLCIFFFPDILKPEAGLPLVIIFIYILGLNILFYLVTFFVYVFELISWKRITNEKFLNNKYIKIFQILGIIFAFLPIMMVVFFLIVGFIQNIIYDIRSID
jgi:hypothetical protein